MKLDVSKRDQISTASEEMVISRNLVLTFIRDEAVEKYANYYTLSTFSITCNIKKIGPGFVIVNFYRFKNIDMEDFFIIKFQISIGCKYQTLVINSTDVKNIFDITISKSDCKEKSQLISIFQRLLSTMTSEKTLLYNKIALIINNSENENRSQLYENAVNFYNINQDNKNKSNHLFLKKRTTYFVPYEKKTIKINGNFLIATLAGDIKGFNMYIFLYAPTSKRRFVVTFPLTVIYKRFNAPDDLKTTSKSKSKKQERERSKKEEEQKLKSKQNEPPRLPLTNSKVVITRSNLKNESVFDTSQISGKLKNDSLSMSDIKKNEKKKTIKFAPQQNLEVSTYTTPNLVPGYSEIFKILETNENEFAESDDECESQGRALMDSFMQDKYKNKSYFGWLENIKLKKINKTLILSFENLEGIVREYVSMRVMDSQDILIETYLDSYLDHEEIFKPYYNIDLQRMQKAYFYITVSRCGMLSRKVDALNIWNFIKSQQLAANISIVYAKFLKDIVYRLEEILLQQISSNNLNYQKSDLSCFKHGNVDNSKIKQIRKSLFNRAKIYSNNENTYFVPQRSCIDDKGFVFKRKPIFSTVFTLRPKRIFTIFVEDYSKIKSKESCLSDLQFAKSSALRTAL
jgi:hypothetical protein